MGISGWRSSAAAGSSATRRTALREELFVPAEQTMSCAFAGSGLWRLYVTTATEDWGDEQRRAEPTAGLTYRFETDVIGRPAAPFGPIPGGGPPCGRSDSGRRSRSRRDAVLNP